MARNSNQKIRLNTIFSLTIFQVFIFYQQSSAQTYNTYNQGSNNSAGSHYVPPVVVKSYGTSGSGTVYGSGSTVNSATNTSGSNYALPIVGTHLYRSSWDRRLGRQQMRQFKEIQAKETEAREWQNMADAVARNYSQGDLAAAEEIRRSIHSYPPASLGAYLMKTNPDPVLGYNSSDEYDLRSRRAYHFTCILLLAELKDYKEVMNLYWLTFSERTLKDPSKSKTTFKYDPNNYNFRYNHQEQTPKLIKAFSDLSYSNILKLEAAFLEAYMHERGITEARKHWTEVSEFYFPYIQYKITDTSQKSLCFNILAMTQLQLGLYEDAIVYSKKQLALHPEIDYLQFSAYQNLVEFILASPQRSKLLIDYCIKGFDRLVSRAAAKNFNSEFIYYIKYNLANLYQLNKEFDKAEDIINSQKDIAQKDIYAHTLLKYSILSQKLHKIHGLMDQADEAKKLKENSIPNNTPEEKKIYDSLYISGYFDLAPGQNYFEQTGPVRERLSIVSSELLKIADTLSDYYQSEEMHILFAENNIRLKYYDNAKSAYEMVLIGKENYWPYQLRLAEINSMMKNDKEAVSILKKSIDENPEEYQLYLALADIYRSQGQLSTARQNYQLAISKGAFLSDEITAFINSK